MFHFLAFSIIPLILLLTAPVLQVVASIFVLRGKIRLGLFWVNFLAIIAGFILPVCATMLAIAGLPAGIKCITGYVGMVILGWMIGVVVIPIVALVFYIIFLRRKKNQVILN